MSELQSETSEDLIDMDEHRLVVEAGFDFFFVQILSDIFILAKIFVEIFSLKPAFHRISLYPAICGVAVSAFRYESEEDARAVDKTAGEVEIGEHLVRIDEELVDEVGGLREDVVQSDGRIWEHDAFDGGVGNISFMPERDVFEGREAVALDETGHAADSFGLDRISLMRHRRGAFLLRAEVFFRFSHFGSLQVADFESHLCEGAGDDA